MKIWTKKFLSIVTVLSLISVSTLSNFIVNKAYAGLISSSSVQMGDSRPSQSGVSYTELFTIGTTPIGCMNIVFNTQPDMLGSVPAVLLTTSGTKVSVSGAGLTDGNWTLYNTGNNGTLQYQSATPRTPTGGAVTIVTSGITNTSATTFYAQITTYASQAGNVCSTVVDQSNVIALATLAGVTASVTISPTIAFSIADYPAGGVNDQDDTGGITTSSSAINFGTVAAGATAWGAQTLTVSTNGAHGYTLYVRDSQSLTNPNNDQIRDHPGSPGSTSSFDASSSQSSFAYTADGAGVSFGSSPNVWAGLTQTNTAIALRSGAVNADATHIEYKIGISNVQPPGSYSTVVAYTATPSY
jgi:hypothetical protein